MDVVPRDGSVHDVVFAQRTRADRPRRRVNQSTWTGPRWAALPMMDDQMRAELAVGPTRGAVVQRYFVSCRCTSEPWRCTVERGRGRRERERQAAPAGGALCAPT
jgi:hypothetical protein